VSFLANQKILIAPSSFSQLDKDPLNMLIKEGADIVMNPYKRRLTKAELFELLDDNTSGIIAGLEPLDKEVMSRSKLKVISRCGAGLSNVDLAAAKDLGIKVCYTPDGPTSAVAELTIGALFSVARMIPQMNSDLHNGKWSKRIGSQIMGKTAAVIGYGRIGRRVADILKSLGVNVLAVDPCLQNTDSSVETVSLENALRRADIITLHCSGDRCVLSEEELPKVKKGVFILNVARGGVIDEKALQRALKDGRVAGAWLDVFENEPYEGPLKEYPQVILTPHCGSYTKECRKHMEIESVQNLINAFKEKGK